ncbi:MAG TPA: filamentous hemagglutinin N-terminal domain-containing protein [Pseudoduganella sp.]
MDYSKHSKLKRTLLGLALAACFGGAQANPVAPQVAAGQASFSQQGKVFTVANTPNTIINWRSFSIGADEVTRFVQQDAASKVLNRITGQDPSRILGSLQSNGQVYLLNPNGVLFGQGARIDVQGLVASSLALSDADFLAGRLHFSGGPGAGKVAHLGQIGTAQGGQVYLVAPQVENSGIIHAPGGAVMLAAGHSVQLVDGAEPALQVVVSAPADQALNLGQVVAQGGRIGIFGALVNQRGSISADSAVRGAQGQVLLRASSRTMLEGGSRTTARGGGEVAVLGPQVGLTGDARVDASGEDGGGSVLVGGDYRGANPRMPNAQQVYVGKDVVLAADAGSSGKGGKVIVWADDRASVQGSIAARGGALGGDGGLVETSAHQLELGGLRVDAGAPQGRRGQWLLDPFDIEVKLSPGVPATLSDVASFWSGPSTGVTELATSLLNGATADVTLQARHDITFVDPVAIAAPGVGLLAQAGNHILVKGKLTTNGGMLRLQANDAASGAASGSGAVILAAGIESGSGVVELSGAEIAVDTGVLLAGQEMRWKADSMRIGSGAQIQAANSVFLNPYGASTAVKLGQSSDGTPGVLSLDAAELSAITTPNLNIGFAQHGGLLSVEGVLDLASSNAGNAMLTLASSAIAVNGALKPKSGLYLQTGGTVSGAGAITAPVLLINAGSVALNGPNQVMGLAASATGDISFTNSGNLNLTFGNGQGGLQTPGNVTLKASSLNQDPSTPLRAASLTLDGSGQVNLASSGNAVGSLRAQGVGSLNYVDGGKLDVLALSQSDAVDNPGVGNLRVQANELVVTGPVNGNGRPVFLEGAALRLAPTAVVNGGPMLLRAASGSLVSEAGSQLSGVDIGLEANAMSLAGQATAAHSIRVSSVGGAAIRVGGTPISDSGGLVLGNADLGRLAAPNLVIGGFVFDPSGNPVFSGGNITADQLDLTAASMLNSLVLQTRDNVELRGSVRLPATAGLGAEAGGTLTNNAMVSAQSIKVRGGSVVLSGAAGSGMAASMIGIDSAGTVELGGSGPTGTPTTYLGGSALASLATPRLFIAAASGMKVGGAVSLPGREVELEARSGLLQVAAPLQADMVHLNADAMDFTADVTASMASLTPATAGHSITIGAACGSACLSLTQLNRIAAATLGIGNRDDGSGEPAPGTKPGTSAGSTGADTGTGFGAGAIHIGGAANLHPLTTRLGLITTAGITQDTANAAAGLKVQELGIESGGSVQLDHGGNQVARLAAVAGAGQLDFRSALALSVVRLQGGNATTDSGYDINGIQVGGTATLHSGGVLATEGAAIKAARLVARSAAGIGSAAAALQTFVAELDAESSASSGIAPIVISNNAGAPAPLTVLGLKLAPGNGGAIALDNYGPTTLAAGALVSSDSGDIRLTAHSPLSIYGSVLSHSGDILLEAGNSGSGGDNLLVAGGALVKSSLGNVTLLGGTQVTYAPGTVQAPGGSIGVNGEIVTPPVTPPTSIDQCQRDPALPGCQLVLPPTEAQPTNPVQAAVNQTIQLINDTGASATPGPDSVADAPGEGKDKAKKADKSDQLSQEKNSGAKQHEAPAKMYCN